MFDDTEDIVFASSFSSTEIDSKTLNSQTKNKLKKSKILSGIINVSARKPSSSYSQIEKQVVTDIEVKDLARPIELVIPLKHALTQGEEPKCMFLNETTNLWEEL